MNNSVPSKPIMDLADFQTASSLVSTELARINAYLKLKKQQGNIDFLVNAPVGNTASYNLKLTWLTGKDDAKLIKDQIVYIQYLSWLKLAGKYDASLITQLNKSIAIAAASIAEGLMSFAYMKLTGKPCEGMVWNMQQLKYKSLLPSDLQIKARWLWDIRQSIHLYLRVVESQAHTQANVDKGLVIMDLVLDHWDNHFQNVRAGIFKKYP